MSLIILLMCHGKQIHHAPILNQEVVQNTTLLHQDVFALWTTLKTVQHNNVVMELKVNYYQLDQEVQEHQTSSMLVFGMGYSFVTI